VDDPDLRISGASAGLEILLDQVRDLLGREGVEIERILQGDSDGPILFGRGLFESSRRLSLSLRARHISLLFRKTDPHLLQMLQWPVGLVKGFVSQGVPVSSGDHKGLDLAGERGNNSFGDRGQFSLSFQRLPAATFLETKMLDGKAFRNPDHHRGEVSCREAPPEVDFVPEKGPSFF
jgi:hypothetical protein